MATWLVITSFAFGVIGGALAILIGVSFTKAQRARWPVLRRLDGKKPLLAFLSMLCLVIGGGAAAWQQVISSSPSSSGFESVQMTKLDQAPKARLETFARELSNETSNRTSASADYFRAAEREFESFRYSDAASLYEKSIEALATASAFLNLSISRRMTSDSAAAKGAAERGLSIARQASEERLEAALLTALSAADRDLGHVKSSVTVAHTAIDLARRLGENAILAIALAQSGVSKRELGDRDGARAASREALTVFEVLHDRLGQANVLNNLGNLDGDAGDKAAAMQSLRKALELYEKEEYLLGQAQVRNSIGVTLSDTGDFASALVEYRTASDLFAKAGYKQGVATIAHNLCADFILGGRLDDAMDECTKATEIAAEIRHPRLQVGALTNIGIIHNHKKQYDRALEAYDRALNLNRQVNNPDSEILALDGKAYVFRDMGRLKDAKSAIDEAIALCDKTPTSLCKAGLTNTLGEILQAQGNTSLAVEKFDAAIHDATIAKLPGLVMVATGNKGLALETQGRIKDAVALLDDACRQAESIGQRDENYKIFVAALARLRPPQRSKG